MMSTTPAPTPAALLAAVGTGREITTTLLEIYAERLWPGLPGYERNGLVADAFETARPTPRPRVSWWDVQTEINRAYPSYSDQSWQRGARTVEALRQRCLKIGSHPYLETVEAFRAGHLWWRLAKVGARANDCFRPGGVGFSAAEFFASMVHAAPHLTDAELLALYEVEYRHDTRRRKPVREAKVIASTVLKGLPDLRGAIQWKEDRLREETWRDSRLVIEKLVLRTARRLRLTERPDRTAALVARLRYLDQLTETLGGDWDRGASVREGRGRAC